MSQPVSRFTHPFDLGMGWLRLWVAPRRWPLVGRRSPSIARRAEAARASASSGVASKCVSRGSRPRARANHDLIDNAGRNLAAALSAVPDGPPRDRTSAMALVQAVVGTASSKPLSLTSAQVGEGGENESGEGEGEG